MRTGHLCSLSIVSPSSHPALPHSLLGLSHPSENIRGVLALPRGYSLSRSSQRSRSRCYHPSFLSPNKSTRLPPWQPRTRRVFFIYVIYLFGARAR